MAILSSSDKTRLETSQHYPQEEALASHGCPVLSLEAAGYAVEKLHLTSSRTLACSLQPMMTILFNLISGLSGGRIWSSDCICSLSCGPARDTFCGNPSSLDLGLGEHTASVFGVCVSVVFG